MKAILLKVVMLFSVCNCFSQNKTPSKGINKMEQEKILQVIQTMYSETDKKNWQKVQNIFNDSVLLDFTSVNGGSPSMRTPEQITHTWSAFDSIKHHMSSFEIKENGYLATAHYLGRTEHFFDKAEWTVEASYDVELEKIERKWLITKYKINYIRQSGDTTLPAKAAEKMKNH